MDRAVMVALDYLTHIERERTVARERLGEELRAARENNRERLPALLAAVRDRDLMPLAHLARLAGISRTTLYELLGEHDWEGDR